MFGFINLNKPAGLTSRAAINSIKHLVKPAKVGHTGTLDPLATGVLVTAIGPATRLTQFVQAMPKRYVGRFRLGFRSSTEDIEGDVEPLVNPPIISEDQLIAVLRGFTGSIQQTPPRFSALNVNGKRAYTLARAGKNVTLKPRTVRIDALILTAFDYPDFELAIECGGGTYVRSLGRDIARALGTEAIMTSLQRTAVGAFSIDTAVNPDQLDPDNITEHVLPPQTALPDVKAVTIDNTTLRQLTDAVPWMAPKEDLPNELLAIDRYARLVALLRRSIDQSFTPIINFAPYWKQREQKEF